MMTLPRPCGAALIAAVSFLAIACSSQTESVGPDNGRSPADTGVLAGDLGRAKDSVSVPGDAAIREERSPRLDSGFPELPADLVEALDPGPGDVASPDEGGLFPDVPPDVPTTPDLPTTQCAEVPVPDPVSMDPLEGMSPAGKTETTTKNGFTDDYLYDGTDYLKIGARRDWGATIIFFGISDGSPGLNNTNVIDANDTGREVQIALYDPLRIKQGCAWNASCVSDPGTQCPNSITYLGWNPVQGGNQCNIGSGTEWVNVEPGMLEAGVIPRHWNPDWELPDCGDSGCSDPAKKYLQSDVLYTQRIRFVKTHIAELKMTVDNLSDIDHPPTGQEFPTLYAVFGKNGTSDLRVLLNSEGQQVAIDIPANDGFFYKNFDSPGAWVTLQNEAQEYGVGLYYENRLTAYQGWQKYGVFNNVRSQFPFGLAPSGTVMARAYLVLGSFSTIQGQIAWLDNALPPFGVLDAPAADAVVSGDMKLAGWVLDNKGISALDLHIDGALHQSLFVDVQRPDVCKVYPGYSMCEQVGFAAGASLAGLTPCPHLLEIVATDTDGNTRTIAKRRVFVQ